MAGYTSPAPWWVRQRQPIRAGYCSPAVWIGWKNGSGIPKPVPEPPGGGSQKLRKPSPGVIGNKSLAFTEDEEIILVLQALLGSRQLN